MQVHAERTMGTPREKTAIDLRNKERPQERPAILTF